MFRPLHGAKLIAVMMVTVPGSNVPTVGPAVLSALAGLLAWAGAASQGVSIGLPQMLEAGANCLPVSLLFLGLAALAYATIPRASAGIAYGLVTLAFLWQLMARWWMCPNGWSK
jgi:hypothetical protein